MSEELQLECSRLAGRGVWPYNAMAQLREETNMNTSPIHLPNASTISLPDDAKLPAGYRYGAHVRGSEWYLIRERDEAIVYANLRPDITMDDAEILELLDGGLDWYRSQR